MFYVGIGNIINEDLVIGNDNIRCICETLS